MEPLFEEWQRFTQPSLLSQTMTGHLKKNKARWSRLRYAQASVDVHSCSRDDEPEGGEGGGEEEEIEEENIP